MGRDVKQKIRGNKSKIFSERLVWFQKFFIVSISLFIVHLFILQIVDLRHFRIKAIKQRRANSFVMRGNIYDRNGIKLATDTLYYDIFARKADFVHTPEELAKMLAPILKMSQVNLAEKLSQNVPFISIKKNVDRKTRDEIAKLHLREIPMDKKSIRTYPQGALASHVLGYYNFDADVASGVEYTAKDKLESVASGARLEITPKGKVIYNLSTDPVAVTKPQKGEDVTLTIDAAVQHVCEKALMKSIQEFKALRGGVIVMNPRNGEILAYAVYPYFDPNNFKSATSFQIKNWTLTDVFPPGSTFKAITIASAMELEKINRYTKVNDTGKIKVGWWPIKNYDYPKTIPGMIDLVYLFEHSSNVGSVLVAQMMSKQEFYDMLKKFGFGEKTGIDLPGESSGILKNASKWDTSDHASMGYGYATSVTAIQMASAVSAIANDGVRVTPHVIKYSPEEEAIKVKKVQVMSAEHARTVTDLLTTAINNSKSIIKMDSFNIAAKTGTSRKPKENGGGYYTNKYYTSIVGYLPAKDPQVLIYVVIDSAQGAEIWGNTVAAPIFKEISTQVAHILNLQPDKK